MVCTKAERIADYGIDPAKIFMEGLPGRSGANAAKATVHLQLPSLQGQPMYTWPRERVLLIETQPHTAPAAAPAVAAAAAAAAAASAVASVEMPAEPLSRRSMTPRSSVVPRRRTGMATSASPPRAQYHGLAAAAGTSESPLRGTCGPAPHMTVTHNGCCFSPTTPSVPYAPPWYARQTPSVAFN